MLKAISSRHKRKRHPELSRGRVFIIGAGVSSTAGIAVADRILHEAMIKLVHVDSSKARHIHRLLGYLYPDFDEEIRNYPNIEDFLNLLEMAKRFNSEEFIESKLWSKKKLEEVKTITLRAVTDYIWSLMGEKSKQRYIQDFVHRYLRRGDTIITFNWDLTMERALEQYPGDPRFWYSYSRKRTNKSFSLLKPHGSIDWFQRKVTRNLVSEAEVGKLDSELCYYPCFDRGDHPDLAKIPPVIVPPIASKEFKFEYLKRTWCFVHRAISAATEIQIIGYSLPREDQFARLVFRRAIRNNIVKWSRRNQEPANVLVVNPDPATEMTFSRLVGRKVRDFDFIRANFEDYVEAIQN